MSDSTWDRNLRNALHLDQAVWHSSATNFLSEDRNGREAKWEKSFCQVGHLSKVLYLADVGGKPWQCTGYTESLAPSWQPSQHKKKCNLREHVNAWDEKFLSAGILTFISQISPVVKLNQCPFNNSYGTPAWNLKHFPRWCKCWRTQLLHGS